MKVNYIFRCGFDSKIQFNNIGIQKYIMYDLDPVQQIKHVN